MCAEGDADDVQLTSYGDVISGIDDVTFDQSAVMTSFPPPLLLLQSDDKDVTSSCTPDSDAITDHQTNTNSPSPIS